MGLQGISGSVQERSMGFLSYSKDFKSVPGLIQRISRVLEGLKVVPGVFGRCMGLQSVLGSF